MKTKPVFISSLICVILIFTACQKDYSLIEETSLDQMTVNKDANESNIDSPWRGSHMPDEIVADVITNYPDPFKYHTTIHYIVPGKETWINLVVYNQRSEMVAELVNELQGAGKSTVQFNASGLPDGRYVAELKIGQMVYREEMTKKTQANDEASNDSSE